MDTPYIEIQQNDEWKNWHRTIDAGGKVNKLFKPFNKYENENSDEDKPFRPGMKGLKEIIQLAATENASVRAYGSRWSLNNIAYNNDYLVNSNELQYCQIGIEDKTHVTSAYQQISNQLAFVQCGVMVRTLNKKLLENDLALPTSGASDGQTFVGAVSTGTHGSAHSVGSMQDYVRGIHLVTLSNELVFLQRKSDPVITDKYCEWLGDTKLIEDDELFNAALVAFGSFGFVHGLLMETTPLYLLEKYIKQTELTDDVINAIGTLNMEGLGLPKGNKLPFHFEVVLNPYYQHLKNKKGAFIRVLYKQEITNDTASREVKYLGNNDIIETLMQTQVKEGVAKHLLAEALQVELLIQLTPTKGEMIVGYPGEQFSRSGTNDPTTSPAPLPGTSIEIGVPLDRAVDAMYLVLEQCEKHPFGAPLAFRYVKNSKATLAFTQYGPISVAMEMPGIDNSFSSKGHQAIFDALAESDIPHSYHWGQAMPHNKEWVNKSYGKKVEIWKQKRLELLGEKGVRMFTNEQLEIIGLS